MQNPQLWLLLGILCLSRLDFREELLAASLATDRLLENLSCKVVTVSEGGGKVETTRGYMIRRPNYFRVVSQTRAGTTDLEVANGTVRMTGPGGNMIMRSEGKSRILTAASDWLMICRLRLFSPELKVVLLPQLLQDYSSHIAVEKVDGDAVVSYSIGGRVDCQLTLARDYNWLPSRYFRKTMIDALNKKLSSMQR